MTHRFGFRAVLVSSALLFACPAFAASRNPQWATPFSKFKRRAKVGVVLGGLAAATIFGNQFHEAVSWANKAHVLTEGTPAAKHQLETEMANDAKALKGSSPLVKLWANTSLRSLHVKINALENMQQPDTAAIDILRGFDRTLTDATR